VTGERELTASETHLNEGFHISSFHFSREV